MAARMVRNRDDLKIIANKTYEAVDSRIFLEHQIECQGSEEDNCLDIIEVRYPVRALTDALEGRHVNTSHRNY